MKFNQSYIVIIIVGISVFIFRREYNITHAYNVDTYIILYIRGGQHERDVREPRAQIPILTRVKVFVNRYILYNLIKLYQKKKIKTHNNNKYILIL